jgi:uncharacterized glyoxalase superfamily protein PhnB
MKAKAIPEGFSTITPYFNVRGAIQYIEFLKRAFDARVRSIARFSDGSLLSAELRVGNSVVVIGETDPDEDKTMRARLYMYVRDVDAVFKKAIKAGAKSIEKPADQFWGDRSGVVEDIAGNLWWIATHQEDMSTKELVRRAEKVGS